MADLTTLVDVKRFLGNRTKENDELLTTLISAVTSEVEEWLQRGIVQATATGEKISVSVPSIYAQTKFFPIISIAALTEGETALTENTDFEIKPDDKASGLIVRISGVNSPPIFWSSAARAIQITYTHGYATIPAGIQQAATSLVSHDFYASVPSDKARFGLTSRTMSTGEDSVFKSRDDLWKEQLPRLSPYRRLAP